MTEMSSFDQANKILQSFISETHSQLHGYNLDQMSELMNFLGNPQDNYKVIHVAGTSGKTSTCYYMSAFLKSAGKKVGLTVSPHVDQINERVQINLKPLKEKEYCKELSNFIDKVSASGIKPTYFELLAAFAFWEFDRQKVDYAVVEVGLGGLFDGTNVISRGDKVCIITDIGLDHVEVLGETLDKIAAQKAGIILPGNHVFTYVQDKETNNVITNVCEQKGAVLHQISPAKTYELPEYLPLFQKRNWFLAKKVYEHICDRDELTRAIDEESTLIHIPARMQIVKYKNKIVILDGAHNSQKLTALTSSIKDTFPDDKITVVAGFVRTKQSTVNNSLQIIASIASHTIFTGFEAVIQDRYSIGPNKLADKYIELGESNYQVIADPVEAFNEALNRQEPIILVAGSFYLLNSIRPVVLKQN